MNEKNLPCSDCGTELVDRMVEAQHLPVATSYRGEVRIAECPSCQTRYYPERALSQLASHTNTAELSERGDVE